jgi:hypothetical protein
MWDKHKYLWELISYIIFLMSMNVSVTLSSTPSVKISCLNFFLDTDVSTD